MVVSHSDDEVLFAGGQMARMRKLCIVHTTDGARSRGAAAERGFASRRAYARAREAELRAALAAGGIEAECINFGYRDSALCLRLGAAVRRLARLIDARKPEVVLTQAYDGGHIDHDTTAAVVQFALERCDHRPAVWEMGGYYVAGGERVLQRLLPREGDAGIVVTLDGVEQARKAAMMADFRGSEANQENLQEQEHAGLCARAGRQWLHRAPHRNPEGERPWGADVRYTWGTACRTRRVPRPLRHHATRPTAWLAPRNGFRLRRALQPSVSVTALGTDPGRAER